VVFLGVRSLDGDASLAQVLASCPVTLLPRSRDVDSFVLGVRDPHRLPRMDWREYGNGEQENGKNRKKSGSPVDPQWDRMA
jgi:hypothetical protein